MPERTIAAAGFNPTEHAQVQFLGLTFNVDTIIGTVIAASVVLGLGLLVRARITAGVPGGVQLAFETVVRLVRNQVDDRIGIKVAPYVVPIAMCLFVFILTCNWMSVLPLNFGPHALLEPPTADVNLTYAMALLMFCWQHIAGIRAHRGVGKHMLHVAKGHFPPFASMWVTQAFVDPLSLAWRLFGNMFAGGLLISILTLLPSYVFWLPAAAWKLFDLGIGLLQAYLFILLTIEYFREAIEIR
jgi:F-type H+-transporting ATPase subunit a